jgi:hypothetical protein
MTTTYTHPNPDPAHVMRSYRKYLIGQKRIWMSQNRTAKRCLRGLIRYRAYIDEYLAAKRLMIERCNITRGV